MCSKATPTSLFELQMQSRLRLRFRPTPTLHIDEMNVGTFFYNLFYKNK